MLGKIIILIVISYAASEEVEDTRALVPSAIFFQYYFGSKTPKGQRSSDQLMDASDGFIRDNPTYFITHGWDSSIQAEWVTSLKDALLSKVLNSNVFLVDWSAISKNMVYPSVKRQTVYVGSQVALFMRNNNINSGSVHFLGHSLGSHVAGIAGYRYSVLTGQKISRITGLDPASPLYSNMETPLTEKLDKSDAEFVDTIFTAMAYFRSSKFADYSLGHVNFFPNGGDNQPGCLGELSLDISQYIKQPRNRWKFCSHSRAAELFIDSILHGNLVGYNCSYTDLQKGACVATTSNKLGFPVNRNTLGDFVLTTTSKSPYANDDFILIVAVNSIDVPFGVAYGRLTTTLPSSNTITLANSLVSISNGKKIRKFVPVPLDAILQGKSRISYSWSTFTLFTSGTLKANFVLATPDFAKTVILGSPVVLKNGGVTSLLAG